MSEIFGSIRLKEKMAILMPMIAFAVILATSVGVVSFCTADRHTHIYDYTLEKVDGEFVLNGICTVENCEDPFLDEQRPTDVKLLSSVQPTCSANGERVYSYDVDGTTVTYTEVIATLPHSYDFELVHDGETATIVGECTEEDCQDHEISIEGVTNFELVSEVKGDCFTPDRITYSYQVNGETKTFTTLSLITAPHTIAGQTTDKIENSDGSLNFGTAGVYINADQPYACGTNVEGFFVCEHCKQIVSTEVRYPEHVYAYNEEKLVMPTLEADGCAVLDCQNEGCGMSLDIVVPKIVVGENTVTVSGATELYREVVKYEYISAEHDFSVKVEFEVGELLVHKYEYKLEIDTEVNSGKINLVGKCNQPDCQSPDYFEADVDASCVDTSTCLKPGVVTWSYEKDGEIITLSVVSMVKSHHKYTYDGNRAIPPTIYNNGMIEIHCETEGCTEVILLTLPKVVIDENTVITGEIEGNLIGEYTYFDEKTLCTIKLTVTIYREGGQ